MAWTAPRTWTNGEVVTDTLLNTHLRDNLLALLHPLTLSGTAVDVQNTVTETSLGSFTVPGNSMGANGTVYALYAGDFLWNNNTANQINLRIKFGGTTHIQGLITPALGGLLVQRMFWALEVRLINAGTTSTQFLMSSLARPRVGGTSGQTSLATWQTIDPLAAHALPTIDTTADRTFDVSAQWSAASANNSWRRYIMHAQIASA
jgi:hypothetical protein